MSPRLLPLGSALLPLLAFGAPAHAQTVDGAFRLSAGGPLFSVETLTLEGDVSGEVKNTNVSLLGSGFGVGLGGGLSENVFLGARLAFDNRKLEVDGESSSASGFSLQPRLEIMAREGAVRPYFVGTVGYRSLDGEDMKSSNMLIGGGLGFHCFASDDVSIDPELLAAYFSGEAEVGGVEATASGFGFMLGITLSSWLGGRPAAAPPSASADAAAPSPPEPDEVASEPVRPRNVAFTDPQGGVTVDTTVGPLPFRLVGRPRKYGNVSSSEIKLPGFVSVCDGAAFELGNETLAATQVKVTKTSRVTALWETSTLLRVVKYDGYVRFVGCGFAATLNPDDRKAIASYMRKFQRVAERSGTWPAVVEDVVEESEAPAPNVEEPAAAPEAPTPEAPEESAPAAAPAAPAP